MKQMLRKFMRDESGEDIIEYGLMTAFVAALATAIIVADPLGLKAAIVAAFTRAATALNSL